MDKKKTRLRRATKARAKIKELKIARLSIHRTPRNIYAQLIMPSGKVAAVASTLEKEIKNTVKNTGNIAAASLVGKHVAERALKFKIKQVAFDRSGFKYHGRVKALADAAREGGLKF